MSIFNVFNKKTKKRNEIPIDTAQEKSDNTPVFQKDVHYEASSQKGPNDG